MPESAFFRGLQPLKFFVFGLFFSLKCRKNANTKNFEGGGGGEKTNLCVEFLWVFFFALQIRSSLMVRDEKTWALAKRRFLIINTPRAQIQN